MKILFVSPAAPDLATYTSSAAAPLGLLSLCTYLNKRGHTCRICDRSVNKSDFNTELDYFTPDIVGVSLISFPSIPDAVDILRLAKRRGLPVVFGGPLASTMPETLLKLDGGLLDLISIGEGEISWLHILEYYDGSRCIDDVGSIARLKDGKIKYNRRAPFADLSELGVLDWSLIEVGKYFETFYGFKNGLHIYASKGCPGGCTFCFNPWFHMCSQRMRPIDHVIAEISLLHEKYCMRAVYFADECFGLNREWLREFCAKLKKADTGIFWGCQTRADIFTREDFDLMYSAGCRWLFIGVESGSPGMLKTIRKDIDLDLSRTSVNDARDAGLNVITSFIIGMPGETESQLRETVDFAKSINTSQYQFNFYIPVPFSAMFNKLPDVKELKRKYLDLDSFLSDYSMLSVSRNYSEIPEIELRTVRAYFLWKSFWHKDNTTGRQKRSFAVKTAADAVKRSLGHGVVYFFSGAFGAAQMFFGIMYDRYFHPEILKKYGLR